MRKRVRFLELFALCVGLTVLSGCGSSNNTPSGSTSPPAPDFSLNLSPQSLFVPIGVGSPSLQVSVQSINGFNQAVSVSVTGLPTGVTTTPSSPFSVNAGNSQTVVFSATTGLPPGVQQVSFQATSGTLSHGSAISLSVANPVYAYVANGSPGLPPNDIAGFAVDSNTGAVSTLPPTSLPNSPSDIAVASESGGAFVFVLTLDNTSQDPNTLSSFKVDPGTGSLTLVQTINYQPSLVEWFMAVHPSGKFLYVSQPTCTQAYPIDPATGNLTQSSCSSAGVTVPGFAPPGNFAYAQIGALINTYSVNLDDGSLTFLQSQDFADGGLLGFTFVTDPLGHALYATAPKLGLTWPCGFLFAWAIDPQTGLLTEVYDSFNDTWFGPLCFPGAPSFTPTNAYAYVANAGNGSPTQVGGIFGAAVDPVTGNLTNVPGTPVATKSELAPHDVLVEPSQGKFVIEEGGFSRFKIFSWAIDSTTGALTQVSGVAVPFTEAAPLKMVILAPPPPGP